MSQRSPAPLSEKIVVIGLVSIIVGFLVWAAIPNFVRSGTSPANSCINNLRQIEAAKEEWALEKGRTNGTVVTTDDITPYIQLNSNSSIPSCPSGGVYKLGKIGELPTCSIGTNASQPHVLTMEPYRGDGGH